MDNARTVAPFVRVLLPVMDLRHAAAVPAAFAAASSLVDSGATLVLLGLLPAACGNPGGALGEQRGARASLDAIAAELRLAYPRLTVETEVRAGEASDQIAAAVRERALGLVVLSAETDTTPLTDARLAPSSPLTRALHVLTVPVVLVPPPRPGDVARMPPARRLVVPLDGSDIADQALPLAESLAGRLGLTIRLLTVIDPDQVLPPTLAGRVRPGTALYGELLAGFQVGLQCRLDRTVRRLRSVGIAATARLHWGPAASCIAGVTEPGDVIVLSSHGRGEARWPVGSVAAEVVRVSRVPVVVLRAGPSPEIAVATYPETARGYEMRT